MLQPPVQNRPSSRQNDEDSLFWQQIEIARSVCLHDFNSVRVSVVMAAYNRQNCIAAAIASVLTQSHANLALIIADDGSNDETRTIASKFLAEGERINREEKTRKNDRTPKSW